MGQLSDLWPTRGLSHLLHITTTANGNFQCPQIGKCKIGCSQIEFSVIATSLSLYSFQNINDRYLHYMFIKTV